MLHFMRASCDCQLTIKFATSFQSAPIKHFQIWRRFEFFRRSSSLKQIEQKNLRGLKELRELLVPINDIESIDSDLFQFNPKIQRIDLSHNKLKNVGLALFTSLKFVTFANFKGNECTDETLKSDKIFFINKIREQCLPTLSQLQSDVIFLAHENEATKLMLEARDTFIKENCNVYDFRSQEQIQEIA